MEFKTYQCISNIAKIQCSSCDSIYQIDTNRIVVGGYDYLTIVDISDDKNKIVHQEYFSGIGDIYAFILLRDKCTLIAGCDLKKIIVYNLKSDKYDTI